jgi:anti-sigma regulatory factor (Ser/Thr protein kinase)
MIIQEEINIPDDYLSSGIIPVVRIMNKIYNCEDEEVIIDCLKIRFVSPVFVISLMLFTYSCRKKVSLSNITTYLETILFFNELEPDKINSYNFISLLQTYLNKTYIPVISFPALANKSTDKDAILSAIENLLCNQLNLEKNVLIGLKYILAEMVDNITEHSESERGYLFAQSYPSKGYIDICIADQGITLKGSFDKAGMMFSGDVAAMRAANDCKSSKNLPSAENRGYGIYTSKNMLIEGLRGQFMMMSGSAIYLKDKKMYDIIELPRGFRLDGTLVALRLPYQNKDFLYTKYFE